MNRSVVIGINLLGIVLVVVGMFMMPWIALDELVHFLANEMGQRLRDLIAEQSGAENAAYAQIVIDIITSLEGPTGWQLATEVPTVSGFFQIVLFLPLVIILLSLVTLVISWSQSPQGVATLALAQAGGGILVGVMLFLYAGRVRVLGLNPDTFGFFFTAAGVTVGAGFYVCIVGLLILGVGGFLLLQMSPSQGGRSGGRSGGHRRSSRSSRR